MGEFVMHRLFPIVCNMSLTASVVILAVLAVRLLLRRAPKVFSYALWAVVLFRLLCPVSVTSAVSLLGALGAPAQERSAVTSVVEYVPADIVRNMAPAVTPLPQEPFPAEPGENIVSTAPSVTQPDAAPVSPLSGPVAVLTLTWLTGMALLLLYSVVSLLRLRRRLVGAVRLEDNIYLADYIPSPFVMGLFRPKIYLPSTLTETERGYILRHEQYHLRRRDHVVKLLSFLALCVHWFNPLVWAAFILAGKDMEMSCDEAVVRELGEDIRADYSASLLSLATGRRIVAGMPLAFGEGDTGGRIRNLLNWKRPQPWIIAVCAVVCVGLIALCAANPKGSGTPTEDPPADRTETGQWPSVEAYVQHVMLSQTEARYYAENADGTVSDQPHTAAVTDRKLEYLTKGGELAGLDPDGVLEEWEYFYLVKLDVDTASVALVGGQYYDDEEYFSLDDRHVIVALRHDDGSYDILCDDSINDGGDFFGYHNTMEEAIYDWYVTDRKLDLPLYVEDWIDQINYNNPNDKPGNYPVHRYDVDGGYLYIPGDTWVMSTPERGVEGARTYTWTSAYDTGSQIVVSYDEGSLEAQIADAESVGFTAVDDTRRVWRLDQDGAHLRYYFYPAADRNGYWTVATYWTDLGISNYVHIFIEPQVMYLMAESFTPTESLPAAGASTRTTMTSTYRAEVDGRAADLTVSYTVEQKNGEPQLCSLDSARARNVHGWEQVHLAATVEQHQSLFGSGLYQYLVPVSYEADRGSGWETFQAVVEISLTGQYSPRRTLTQEELAAYNAVMDPAVRDESGDIVDFHIQPFSYFFSSYYKNVRNLNFEEFIRYFPDSGQATEAEFEALKKLDDWPFKQVARMEDMPVPIHRHTISSINEVLTRWGGITTSNLDTSGVCYLEEYDAYYTYTSDFNMFYFIAESGEQVGNYVYLRKSVENGNIAVLTLRLVPGTDEWQIVSHWRSGS